MHARILTFGAVGALTLSALVAVASAGTPTAPSPTALPLGDGKISTTTPQKGFVYACSVPSGGGGAQVAGPWIDTDAGTWDSTSKTHVAGSVTWSSNLSIRLSDANRRVSTNDLPKHPTGVFPVASSDPAYAYDRNPNRIAAQSLTYSLPRRPTKAASPTCLKMGPIAVMNSGAVLFNALDGEGRDAAAHEVLDLCDGHPERNGSYHYHSLSPCVAKVGASKLRVVGWAIDGFPLVAGKIAGAVPTNAALDVCHGTTVRVRINGDKRRTYAYVMTAEYPYSIGCFRGTPIVTTTGPTTPGGGTPPPPPPPPPGG